MFDWQTRLGEIGVIYEADAAADYMCNTRRPAQAGFSFAMASRYSCHFYRRPFFCAYVNVRNQWS